MQMMSKRSLLMVTTLMLAGNSAIAGDVLRVDAVEAVLTGSFQQSCGQDGGSSFSLSADDFAQFPISIDETADCSGYGSLESSADGSFSDNRLEMKLGIYAGGSEGFGEYVYAYSNNDTVVSFTILRDAHVRFESTETGYNSDYYDMGSTSSYGSAVLTDTATGEVLMQRGASSSFDGTRYGLFEELLEAGTYQLTFEFDAGSSCNCGSSSEIEISLEARPVPSMTFFDGITVEAIKMLAGNFPAEAENHIVNDITDAYEDLPAVTSHAFVGAEAGSCSSVTATSNLGRAKAWGIVNGNVILLKSEATSKTLGDSNSGSCELDWTAENYYDFDFDLLRASTVTLERCSDSAQHAYPGDGEDDWDFGNTECRLWDPASEEEFFYSYLGGDGQQCDSVELRLEPGRYRVWTDSTAISLGFRGRTSTAQMELVFHDLADIDRDGRINGADIAVLLGSWGACDGCPADITGDGNVGGDDLSQILGGWAP
jgi:hypothetical protein